MVGLGKLVFAKMFHPLVFGLGGSNPPGPVTPEVDAMSRLGQGRLGFGGGLWG